MITDYTTHETTLDFCDGFPEIDSRIRNAMDAGEYEYAVSLMLDSATEE